MFTGVFSKKIRLSQIESPPSFQPKHVNLFIPLSVHNY